MTIGMYGWLEEVLEDIENFRRRMSGLFYIEAAYTLVW